MKLKKGFLNIFSLSILNFSIVLTGCSNNQVSYQSSNSVEENITSNENSNDEIISNEDNNDEIIIEYFEGETREIEEILGSDSDNIKEKVSEKIITLVDFLFYDGEIKGITFDELSTETKEKLLGILSVIDTKIESKIPNYKDTISDKASSALNWLKEKAKNGMVKIDEYLNSKLDNYDKIKEETSEIIDNTKDDFSEVKDILDNGFSKVKDKYESWRSNVKNN